MKRLTQLGFFTLFLFYLAPVQAMLNIDAGINACPVFADDGDKKDDGKQDGGKQEEEEPDCE